MTDRVDPTGVHRMGDRALLVEVGSLGAVLGLHATLRERPAPGQLEAVAGARSVLLVLSEPDAVAGARDHLGSLTFEARAAPVGEPVELDVCYDGEDLDEVGLLTGLGVDAVIAAHTGQLWSVAFGGFAPGFGYLTAADNRLVVPRRHVPRPRVPTGSVGLAGEFSGVYPRESPGGWQLIGRCAAPLWDVNRLPPALFRAGVQVRFRAVSTLPTVTPSVSSTLSVTSASGLQVVRPGMFTTVQDGGRPGWAESGVSESGAADRGSHREANRLVGNAATAATLEATLGGLTVRAVGDLEVAFTGAAVSGKRRRPDGSTGAVEAGAAFTLADGEELALASPPAGLRSYVAARGGIEVPAVLGSRSLDVLSGLGPAALVRGQVLAVGAEYDRLADDSVRSEAVWGAPGTVTVIPVRPGPHLWYFASDAVHVLCGRPWEVTPQSNRVGIRLSADPISRADDAELPSAPLVAGAVQIPPSGQPVVFLRDHPTTGGYPVLAVATDAGIDRAAQCRPGAAVQFTLLDEG